MERKPLVKERVWLLIGQLMCQVEELAQHCEELERERTEKPDDLWAEVKARNEAADGATTEIPAGTP